MPFTKITDRQHNVHPLGSFAFCSASHDIDPIDFLTNVGTNCTTPGTAQYSMEWIFHHMLLTLALDRTWNGGTGQYACGTCKGASRARFTWSFEIANCEHGHVFNFNDVRKSTFMLHAAQLPIGLQSCLCQTHSTFTEHFSIRSMTLLQPYVGHVTYPNTLGATCEILKAGTRSRTVQEAVVLDV